MTGESQSPHAAAALRRPLATRQRAWARALASALTRWGVSPNAISLASLVFAALAAACLLGTAHADGLVRGLLLVGAAASMQLRLLCNLLDGMVAIEGGRKTRYGEVLNDMPDRIADLMIFVAAGYSLTGFGWGRELGWVAAVLAVLTAYVRLLGGSTGAAQYFIGPMAKQHRMAVMTVACVASVVEPLLGWRGQIVAAALAIVILGSVVTLVRRTSRIIADLKAQ
jgi:phosphatidylglycerophosphate synthase